MKKIIGIALLSVFLQFSTFAQENNRRGLEERIESMKVAYITDALNLSVEQSQDFWPLYNAYNNKRKEMRQRHRPSTRLEDMTEQEAEQFIANRFQMEEEKIQLERNFHQEVRSVISAKQIVKLLTAEKEFKQKLVQRMRERRKQR